MRIENEILDIEIGDREGSSLRRNLIIIECILLLVTILGVVSLRFEGYEEYLIFLIIIPMALYTFFLIFSPLLRFIKKESSGKMALLYSSQNILLIVFFLGAFLKSENWPYASEIIILGQLSLIFLFLIPHLQLKKIDASKQLHLYTFFINFSLLLFFISVSLKLESWYGGNELLAFGGLFCFIILIIVTISFFKNRERFTPIGFYIPRLLLGIYFSFPTILLFINKI